MSGPARRGRQRGFALIIVLWAVVLIASLGDRITRNGHASSQLARNLRVSAEAEAMADGLVYTAAFHLLDATVFPKTIDEPDERWVADGSWLSWRWPGGHASVRIEDEAGKLNPNTAQPELLQALMTELGAPQSVAEQVAHAIVDWRFRRLQASKNGGTEAEYRASGRAYGPPGTPFETLSELGYVLGMTPELLARLIPHLSLYGSASPNPAAADAIVVRALADVIGQPLLASHAKTARPQTVSITVRVETDAGGAFTRRATIRFVTQRDGLSTRILMWDSEPLVAAREGLTDGAVPLATADSRNTGDTKLDGNW